MINIDGSGWKNKKTKSELKVLKLSQLKPRQIPANAKSELGLNSVMYWNSHYLSHLSSSSLWTTGTLPCDITFRVKRENSRTWHHFSRQHGLFLTQMLCHVLSKFTFELNQRVTSGFKLTRSVMHCFECMVPDYCHLNGLKNFTWWLSMLNSQSLE